ncbi:MAG: type IV secretory system conjugative DNA transfer family protein [Nitrososphaerota archaeon]
MIDAFAFCLFATAAAGCGLLAFRVMLAAEADCRRETFRLTFPRSVDPPQVVAALRSVQGLLPRFPDRLVVTRSVSFETVATAAGIAHYLTAPAGKAELLVGQLCAAIPGLRVVSATAPDRYANLARELAVVGVGSLRTETTAESNAALLAACQPLRASEGVIVQWSLSPTEPLPGWLLWLRGRGEAPQRERQPVEPLLRAVCRVGVRSPNPSALLGRVFGAIHRADTPERRLTRRLLPSAWVASRLLRGIAPVLLRSAIHADELAAVIGFPIGGPQLPGLGFAGSRTLPPAPEVPTRGRVLGDAIATDRPVAIEEAESKRGLLVTAPTGAGKSTVLEHLCAEDFAAGRGVIVIESKDLVHRLADLIPADRLGDVLIFDPADSRPAGFNLLAGGEEAADLITDHVVGQFRALYAGYLGPRSEMLLRAALLTLSQAPGSWGITEVMPLLSDPAFRRRLMGEVEDHQLAATWAWFEGQSEAARAEMIGPLANKLAAFTLRRKLRAVVGQGQSALDFDAILRERKIALIALQKALIGEDAAKLLGSCILAELWAAIQRRAALDPATRPFASVVLDEAQDFLRLPVALGDAVAQSRGLGAGWTVAHQNLGQLSAELRAAVLANLRSKLVMQTTADDARTFAREFAPHLDAADFQGLGPFEAYAAVSTGAAVSPPVSIHTRPPLSPTGSGERVRAASRERYGRDPKDVDAEIQARLSHAAPEAPVGARRRG